MKSRIIIMLLMLGLGKAFSQECIQTIKDTSGFIKCISFSPDGKRFVTANFDKSVKIFNAETGKIEKVLEGHSKSVFAVAVNMQGDLIASGGWDKNIRIWNMATGESMKILKGSADKINTLSFHPSGKLLASAGDDKVIRIWDLASGEQIKQFTGHSDYVNSIQYSKDGRYLVSGGSDMKIIIWDAASGTQLKTLTGHTSHVTSVCFSNDGKKIASGGFDRAVNIWDFNTGQLIKSFKRHTEGITSVCFSPDGEYVVSGSEDKTIKIWEMARMMEIRTLEGHGKSVQFVAYNPNGESFVSTGDDITIRVWDMTYFKYEKCIQDLLNKNKHLIAPKDEFESSEKYNKRIAEYEELKKTALEKCKSSQTGTVQTQVKTSSSGAKFAWVTPKITAISNYDADLQQYTITVNNEQFVINMPLEDAKTFKTNWSKAEVKAIKRTGNVSYAQEEYINMEVIHPVSKKRYKFGPQVKPEDDELLKNFLNGK